MTRPAKKHRLLELTITSGVFAAVALLVWLLPVFHLSQIEITEMISVSRDQLVSTSGLTLDQHLLEGLGGSVEQIIQLRYGKVESLLTEAFPTIKTVTAHMKFPGKIVLDITERIKVAYVKIPDGCVMIDKEGVAMMIMSELPLNIPVISGVTVTSLDLGQKLVVDAQSSMNSAISLMGAIIDADKDTRIETALLPQISKILPVGGNSLYLTVVLPNTGEELSVLAETGKDQSEDMFFLRYSLAQGAFDGCGKGILDLTGSHRTFKPD